MNAQPAVKLTSGQATVAPVGTVVPIPAPDLRQGYRECYEILRKHGKTFYFMAKLLGGDRGRGIAAVYGFARTADDTVDEPAVGTTPEQVRLALGRMSEELRRGVDGKSHEPRFAALGAVVRRYGIELYPFDDLLKGVAMDLTRSRYETYEELELYCYRVAGTIGLMITPIAGYQPGTAALEYAKQLGTAFQLTNILRDVGEDLRRGRLYLPRTDLDRFAVSEADLRAGKNSPAIQDLLEFEIARAQRLYAQGSALIPLVRSWTGRLAFQFAIDAYSGILDKIRINGYDVFSRRAHLSFWEKLRIIPRSLWRALSRRRG